MITKKQDPRTIIIIGAGIAGMSAGIYAQMSGYRSRIYEMHDMPGGLMTAWKRKGFTIDGCIHWLTGSSPDHNYYQLWEEIGLSKGLQIYNPQVFSRHEGQHGELLELFTDVKQLEQHLLALAPEDSGFIWEMCAAVRALAGFNPPVDIKVPGGLLNLLRMLVRLPLLRKWTRMTIKDMAGQFKNQFIREVFCELWYPEMSAAALLLTLAMMHKKTAGYPIGGSLPMARAVEKRYLGLDGEIIYGAKVAKILVENKATFGIRLADGREDWSDFVISAADGYTTIFGMLEGRYVSKQIQQVYDSYPIFPPLVYIGLGVKRTFPDLYGLTGGITMQLEEPIIVAGQPHKRLEYVIQNFDPGLAPEGKTVIRVMFNSDYRWWRDLHNDLEKYKAEKQRLVMDVIERLDKRFPGLADQVEMTDVATPVTFERFTGNWQGSYEGFLPTPETLMKTIPKTLPGLDNFFMAGQWVQAGGGLPSGALTGRAVIQMMCKKDRRPFRTKLNGRL